jgi:hypothetical protein
MAFALAYHSSNKPLFGYAKRHRESDPRVQTELDIALGYHVSEGHEKGILLSLWAGANPHARVRDLEYGRDDEDEEELETAVESAAAKGNVGALKRFKPDPAQLDFDRLYACAADRSVVEFLAAIQSPRDLTRIIQNQAFRAGYYMGRQGDWPGALVAVLDCGVRWEAAELRTLAGIRLDVLRADNYELKNILLALMRPETCSPEILKELTRTPTMQRRMLEMRLIKPQVKPPSKAAIERREIAVLRGRYNRERIHQQVWSQPVSQVAKSYGVSGSYLARVCKTLRIPVPARGYWAKLAAGKPVHARPLGRLPLGKA